ncbi:MAG TPA: flagellar hook-associated protein FlgK, partial [Spirochaetota bacterium]|nr:flagellar hook-associated protein FlgK [Spirochaetota bacterium]
MESTFLGIEIGKRSLQLHQKGLSVIGHNLTNSDNEAYSRQRVTPATLPPLYDPSLNRPERAGQIGQGAEIVQVKRDRDMHLDVRLRGENALTEYWKMRRDLLTQVEDVHDALGDVNLQERLDRFWAGWQELAKNPSEPAVRQSLLQD